PVAAIADQFREYLSLLRAVDVQVAGDFLVTAATLLEIKSKLLLPGAADGAAAAPDGEDPRRELVRQLLEYRRFKEAAARLEGRAAERQRRMPRGPAAPAGGDPGTAPPAVRPAELWDLVSAFGRILEEATALAPEDVVADDTPQHVY